MTRMAVSTAKSFSTKGSCTLAPYSVGHTGTVTVLDLGRHPLRWGGYFNTAAASAASGSLAILAAIRLASSRVSRLAAVRLPGSLSKYT